MLVYLRHCPQLFLLSSLGRLTHLWMFVCLCFDVACAKKKIKSEVKKKKNRGVQSLQAIRELGWTRRWNRNCARIWRVGVISCSSLTVTIFLLCDSEITSFRVVTIPARGLLRFTTRTHEILSPSAFPLDVLHLLGRRSLMRTILSLRSAHSTWTGTFGLGMKLARRSVNRFVTFLSTNGVNSFNTYCCIISVQWNA